MRFSAAASAVLEFHTVLLYNSSIYYFAVDLLLLIVSFYVGARDAKRWQPKTENLGSRFMGVETEPK